MGGGKPETQTKTNERERCLPKQSGRRKIVLLNPTPSFELLTCWELEKQSDAYEFLSAGSAEEVPALCGEAFAFIAGIASSSACMAKERKELCAKVREAAPNCKILWLIDVSVCSELTQTAIRTKRSGIIDQFVYNGISPIYLAAVLDTL